MAGPSGVPANPATSSGSSPRRSTERYAYEKARVIARIRQPGDTAAQERIVHASELGADGMSVVHDGYVHNGSEFSAQLTTLHGTWHDVRGTVVDCQLMRGRQHTLQIEFCDRIEPSEYCRDAVHMRVLVVDDDEMTARVATHYLTKLHAKVTHVTDGEAAIQQAKAEVFDLILMEVDMPKLDGLSATRKLRERGYTGVIVAATAHTQPKDRERCIEAGCDDYLPKPYEKDLLMRLLESLHREPIFSNMSGDSSVTELVAEFVSRLPSQIREIEEAVASEDVESLERTIRQLKGQGTSYGFEVITETATEIENTVLAGAPVVEIREQVARFIKLCTQVRVARAPTAGTVDES